MGRIRLPRKPGPRPTTPSPSKTLSPRPPPPPPPPPPPTSQTLAMAWRGAASRTVLAAVRRPGPSPPPPRAPSAPLLPSLPLAPAASHPPSPPPPRRPHGEHAHARTMWGFWFRWVMCGVSDGNDVCGGWVCRPLAAMMGSPLTTAALLARLTAHPAASARACCELSQGISFRRTCQDR